MRSFRAGLLVALCCTMTLVHSARADGPPGWPQVTLTPYSPASFSEITELAVTGDGSGRVYVVERPGTIRVILPGGDVAPGPFFDISALVVDEGPEQGLLGLAFSPNFANDHVFFVNYTGEGGHTHVSRFTAFTGLDADESSEQVVLFVEQPYANHNGGHLAFGPDGLLYIGMGDGGSGGDPQNHAQTEGDRLGKFLRYNPVDGAIDTWAKGLRNPWKFSFDVPSASLYIADVGQNMWEEVNVAPLAEPGLNYGWRFREGTHCYNPVSDCPSAGLIAPAAEYGHAGGRCSVTGGYVDRRAASPLEGIYVYADYCSGEIFGLRKSANASWESALVGDADGLVTTFGLADNGTMLAAVKRGAWQVYRLDAAPPAPVLPALPFHVRMAGLANDR
jgi:hypothetical protein